MMYYLFGALFFFAVDYFIVAASAMYPEQPVEFNPVQWKAYRWVDFFAIIFIAILLIIIGA